MPADKPQFKVYLEASTLKDMHAYALAASVTNGKLVEQMWAVFSLSDWQTLVDKIERYTQRNPFQQGKSPIALIRLHTVLGRWLGK